MSAPLCQWAACKRRAVTFADGWGHCKPHLAEHLAFMREQDRLFEREERAKARDHQTLKAAIRNMHRLGFTDAEMAKQLSIVPASVRHERMEMGLPPNRVQGDSRELEPCGTHAAFARHKNRGEEPCDACKIGERVYQRMRKRGQRRNSQEAAA